LRRSSRHPDSAPTPRSPRRATPAEKPPMPSTNPKSHQFPLLLTSSIFTVSVNRETMNVAGMMIPCHRPSQRLDRRRRSGCARRSDQRGPRDRPARLNVVTDPIPGGPGSQRIRAPSPLNWHADRIRRPRRPRCLPRLCVRAWPHAGEASHTTEHYPVGPSPVDLHTDPSRLAGEPWVPSVVCTVCGAA
jgi:hypothetical protein